MVPMPFTELAEDEKQDLLDIAWQSVKHGLEHGRALKVDPKDFTDALQAHGACFVTLHRLGQLRGCIGSLEAYRPLVTDVAEHAFDAAFHDPRFPALRADEYDSLELEISILTPPESMHFSSEQDLLDQVRPGVDGLIIEDHGHRGTFLPAVWESLPKKEDFFSHLKQKAGLPANYWSETLKVSRYGAVKVK